MIFKIRMRVPCTVKFFLLYSESSRRLHLWMQSEACTNPNMKVWNALNVHSSSQFITYVHRQYLALAPRSSMKYYQHPHFTNDKSEWSTEMLNILPKITHLDPAVCFQTQKKKKKRFHLHPGLLWTYNPGFSDVNAESHALSKLYSNRF